MDKISYFANLAILPVFFLICLVKNLYKMAKQAVRWSISETKDAYRSNRRYHKLVD